MKLTKKILIGSLAAFAIAMLTGCPGDGPTPPNPHYEGENKLGTPSENLVNDGDADGYRGEIYAFGLNDVEKTVVAGGVTGNAYKMKQTGDEWCEFTFDLTDYYGPGKSFLISAKIKGDPEVEDEAIRHGSFTACYCVYSGDVQDWAVANNTKYYDFKEGATNKNGKEIVGPWGGEKDVEGEDFDFEEEMEFNVPKVLTDDWQEIKYIITSTEIERMINDSGLYKMEVEFYAGPDAAGGYSYLIDDISIIDLNSEIKRAGQTWVDPTETEEDEEEEE